MFGENYVQSSSSRSPAKESQSANKHNNNNKTTTSTAKEHKERKHHKEMSKHQYAPTTPSLEVRSHNLLYPNNEYNSQWQQEEEERPKTVEEIIRALDEQQSVSGPKGGCCSRMCIPFLAIAMVILIFTAVIWTSGSAVNGEANPRVALFIFEGLSATILNQLITEEQRLPNLVNMLFSHGGLCASCASSSNLECARASAVENGLFYSGHYCHACGMASILSGVTPFYHKVTSDSLYDMLTYADSSKQFPSLVERVRRHGMQVTVIGTSHVLNSFNSSNGRCAMAGLLDVECAPSTLEARASSIDPLTGYVSLDCLSGSSCNVAHRRLRQPTDPASYADVKEQTQFTEQLTSLFGSLAFQTPQQKSAIQNTVADNLHDSLFIFHFDNLAVRAESDALADFNYSSSSLPYVAQAYLIDALIGQVLAFVNDRTRSQKENWLVMGVGTKGASTRNASDSIHDMEESAIPFFISTYTTSTKKYVALRKLTRPISQLDVLPTILRWLNVPPFDDITESALSSGSNSNENTPNAASPDTDSNSNNTSIDEKIKERIEERRQFIGQVQGICSSGLNPVDCIGEEQWFTSTEISEEEKKEQQEQNVKM